MREDAKKIICERPRSGGKYSKDMVSFKKRLRRRPEEDEDDTTSTDIRFARTKYFNDFLAPIKGFLLKCSNKKMLWDDAYSEICEVLPKDGTLQIHVHQHLEYMVEKNVVKQGDALYNSKGINIADRNYQWGIFWVDANTGILNHHENKKKAKAPDSFHDNRIIKYDDNYYFFYDKSKPIRWVIKYFQNCRVYVKQDKVWVKLIIIESETRDHIIARHDLYSAKLPYNFDISNSNKVLDLKLNEDTIRRRVADCTFEKVFKNNIIEDSGFIENGWYRKQIGGEDFFKLLKNGNRYTYEFVTSKSLIEILESKK